MKKIKKKIKCTVEITDTGFSSYSDDYPVFTTGKTITELKSNIVEALNLFLEDQGQQVDASNIAFDIDLKQFFQFYRVINATYLSKRIGMNQSLLSQYIHGTKKPSTQQTRKILMGIQEIGRELANLKILNP
jgi:predicted RNase H-like HicB family nuclease